MIIPKPCPFCGSKNTKVVEGENYKWIKMMCVDCDASCGEIRKIDRFKGIDFTPNVEAATEEWNRRA